MNDPEMPPSAVDETCRKKFEAAWNRGTPEPIDKCLPPENAPTYLPTLEELVQIELEYRWEALSKSAESERGESLPETHADPPRVEDYLDRFPQLKQDSEILQRLLRQEYIARVDCGDAPRIDEYRKRFPELDIPEWDVATSIEAAAFHETEMISASPADAGVSGEAPTPAHPLQFGNYDLLDQIGQGGMGIVYRARQRSADRIVGLKVIRRELLTSRASDTQSTALERFHHEVHAAARLEHENIASVYEVGDVDGEPFFSMKYVDGGSLGDVLHERQRG